VQPRLTAASPIFCENVDKEVIVREETDMMRSLFFAALLLGSALVSSGCGIVNHQVNRAANLLTTPLRMIKSVMHDQGDPVNSRLA